jgi:Holliday junction resolvase RusA-like endonuclease
VYIRLSEKEAEELLKNLNANKKSKGNKNVNSCKDKSGSDKAETVNAIWPETKLIERTADEVKITIPLAPITKKNHGNIITYGAVCPTCHRGKYNKLIPSDAHNKYKMEIAPYISLISMQINNIDYPINLKCVFYLNKRYQGDLVGYLQSIQDILVEGGIIEDDNRNIVASTDGSRVFYDKENPRTEITITKVEDYAQWGKSSQKKTTSST